MSATTHAPATPSDDLTAAFAVLRTLDRPTSTGKDVAEALEQDGRLAKQVLRLASSPMYGLNAPELTVQRAVVLLGFITIRKLVVVSLCRALGALNEETEGRWREALWVGIAAEEITLRIAESAAADAFILGMTRQLSAIVESDGIAELGAPEPKIDPERLDRFLTSAELVAAVIMDALPGLPSTAAVDEALEAGGLAPLHDGKLAVDIRRGFDLYASLIR